MPEPLVAIPISISPSELQQDLMAPASRARRETGAEPEPPTDHIIRSKVQPPVVRDSTLSRGRLLEWMDAHADERVRVLAAEAGFGKSTLLADWARRQTQDVRWLKLDPTDAEWSTFITYVVAAYREGGDQTFGKATLKLLAHVATLGTTMEQAVGQLLAELGRYVSEPSVLIIDDLQHVQANAEVRGVIERLVERAPAHMTFILSGRGKPELRLGRQAAQGNVVSLGTDDLRFTRDELNALFTDGYRLPLEGDLLAMVEERTEGWGASLQLLYSTLRDQTPAEIRTFIEGLRGSREPLYDFLAEEVLERQTPFMQRVLLHASVLERILTELVVAAMSSPDEKVGEVEVQSALDRSDELGLMSRSALNSKSRRFHPLLREFLVSHLTMTTPGEQFRQIHLRVARAAETVHWPTSAHHYIEAEEGADAMRVIGDSWIHVLGSGAWGVAMELMARVPHIPQSLRAVAINARWLVAQGDPQGALHLLQSVALEGEVAVEDRAVYRLALASAHSKTQDLHAVREVLHSLVQDDATPPLIASLARAWFGMLEWKDAAKVASVMAEVAEQCEGQGLHHYAATCRHNAAVSFLAAGEVERARLHASIALEQLSQATLSESAAAPIHMVVANCAFASSRLVDCFTHVERATSAESADPDVFAEASLLYAWTGQHDKSEAALEKALQTVSRQGASRIELDVTQLAQAVRLLVRGNYVEALNVVRPLAGHVTDPNDFGLAALVFATSSALSLQSEGAKVASAEALVSLRSANIRRWEPASGLVDAIIHGDANRAQVLLLPDGPLTEASVLVLADILGSRLDMFEPVPEVVVRSVRSWPDRWRPVLRRALERSTAPAQSAAAELLCQIGQDEDIGRLATWERAKKRVNRSLSLSTSLAHRISPTVRIRDLGGVSVTIADRSVLLSDVRRKAAALLMFLVSRPRHTATREQVLDALWPEQNESQAGNSLHQTLYFLRQSIALASGRPKSSVEYIPLESELVRLEPSLVHIESAAFSRQAKALLARDRREAGAASLLRSYEGKFAPEFEYEEWAIPWREFVHSAFLQLTEQTARDFMRGKSYNDAASLLRHAIDVDPEAYDLRAILLAALYKSGAHAAARHLHRVYSEESEREFGEPLPPLKSIVAEETA
ncbi:MAG: BTAD domain-containing putative transcriptional regulator [Chloroflexota bacterium]